MFDVYLAEQAIDPVHRRRMTLATMIALAAVGVLATLGGTASRMSIARVSPPTIDHVLVQLTDVDNPAPPPPPAAPAAALSSEVETDEVVPDAPAPLEQPDEHARLEPPRRAQPSHGVPGSQGTLGVGTGMPGVVGVPPGFQARPGVARVPTATKRRGSVMRPIKSVREVATYAPDPDPKQLARTPSGMMHRRSGTNRTQFCVNERGKVVDVRTERRFPNDPVVDRICRETVKRWRFKPFAVGDTARKTCSVVEFRIEFE